MRMNSEDCSITEKSSLHLERGQKGNATSSHYETHYEGSLQVPIPCAVVNVVIITLLVIALVAVSVGQYNCPGQYKILEPSHSHGSLCSDEWIMYKRKCYFISTTRNTWTSAKNSCSKDGATLAVFESEKDMNFLKRYAGAAKHWIGLNNEAGHTWKWSDGRVNNWFNFTGSEKCAFLNGTDVISEECERKLHWICSKPSRE